MWKLLVFVVLLIIATSGDIQNSQSTITQTLNSTNYTQQANDKEPEISENKNHKTNVEGNNIGKGEIKLINSHQNKEVTIEDVNDTENFKYYWVLLVFSSLSIIGLIVFKSFRLRRNRAEIKYGKPKEADEIQPLGKSKWDDIDSSENEDEIFDINFLKNTRLNPPSDL